MSSLRSPRWIALAVCLVAACGVVAYLALRSTGGSSPPVTAQPSATSTPSPEMPRPPSSADDTAEQSRPTRSRLQYAETRTFDANANRLIARTLSVTDPDRGEAIVRTLDDDGRVTAESAVVGDHVVSRSGESGSWLSALREAYAPILKAQSDAFDVTASPTDVLHNSTASAPAPAGRDIDFDTVEVSVLEERQTRRGLERVARAMRETLGEAAAQVVPNSRMRWSRWWDHGQIVAEDLAAWFESGAQGPQGIVTSTSFTPVDDADVRNVLSFARRAGWNDVLGAINAVTAQRASSTAARPAVLRHATASHVPATRTLRLASAPAATATRLVETPKAAPAGSAPAGGYPAVVEGHWSPRPRAPGAETPPSRRPSRGVPRVPNRRWGTTRPRRTSPGTSGTRSRPRDTTRPRSRRPGRARTRSGSARARPAGGRLPAGAAAAGVGTALYLFEQAIGWYEFGQAVGRKVCEAADALNQLDIGGSDAVSSPGADSSPCPSGRQAPVGDPPTVEPRRGPSGPPPMPWEVPGRPGSPPVTVPGGSPDSPVGDPSDGQDPLNVASYTPTPNDDDWRGKDKTLKDAIDRAFERTGVPRESEEWEPTQWGYDRWRKSHPVEWQVKHGPNRGAEVNIDRPHGLDRDGEQSSPDIPHVGWQKPGKRQGEGHRGHILLDEVPYSRRSDKPSSP